MQITANANAASGRRFRMPTLIAALVLVSGCVDQPTGSPVAPPDVSAATALGRIGDLQGSSEQSPLLGRQVIVPGVVTGNFVNGLDGFFMQDERGAADADPLTSDGVFVQWTAGREPKVRRGDRLRVHGTVAELGDRAPTQTALVEARVEVLGRGIVEATVIEKAPDVEADWERFEGMWLRIAAPLTLAGNYNLARFGEVEASFERRPQSLGVRMPPSSSKAPTRVERTRARMLLLDDNRRSEFPRTLWFLPEPPDAARPLRVGSRLHGVEGILDDSGFGRRLQLTAKFEQVEQAPRPAPPNVTADGLRIGHFNVLNYFNGDGAGGGFPTERGAASATELQRQQAKLVAMIRGIDPDVASLVELENDGNGPHSAQQQLVDALNAADDGDDYRAVMAPEGGSGDDAIRVGLIYRASKLRPVGTAVPLTSGPFADRARPPLAQAFVPQGGGAAFTVVALHLKSKSGCQDVPPERPQDRDHGAGCFDALRTESARALADWIASDPTASGSPHAVLLGDFNANTFEAPMQLLREDGWLDAIDPDDRDGYTYNYRGLANRLDHALLSPSLHPRLQEAHVWHVNSDEAPLFGYESVDSPLLQYAPDAYRSSDHDPLLLVLRPPVR